MQLDFGAVNNFVHQSFTIEEGTPDILTPKEQELAKSYGASRLSDFCKGRLCSRRAMAGLGHGDADLLIGEKKAPIWPTGIVGSISHSKTLAGSIVAENTNIQSLGLDIETIGRVQEKTWYLLFTEAEQNYLRNIDDERKLMSTLLFSMKECFYKLQFPITKTYLDFRDVEIKVIGGQFQLSVIKEEMREVIPRATQLFFAQQDDLVVTYAYWLHK